ncbi:hypothetical protein DEF23_15960 [Marinitenerispora sediminis]|uniref:Uncharacterized protein n=1 Tax=Marinitenerispora sediminis TaxID=1931232 RepID=A0A368SZT2_9ACTN|nr:hypothetical protein DEF24_22915 [Marinitenerispora sediminis]RCV54438.1 hypothetical protein DEF23_15960 [Marinitenerispora sediminis]RCV55348.1 hypothetical protein DEF28_06065 [Marinitenerispora sediminis]
MVAQPAEGGQHGYGRVPGLPAEAGGGLPDHGAGPARSGHAPVRPVVARRPPAWRWAAAGPAR